MSNVFRGEITMSTVTLILPKDTSSLANKYAEALAEIVAARLNTDELEYLISELEKQEINEKVSN